VWTARVRSSIWSGPALTPSLRRRAVSATTTGVALQDPSSAAMVTLHSKPATLPRSMAKAKRRKLRARRSKANHGRRPNAGRG
jgi:hypothetical protein